MLTVDQAAALLRQLDRVLILTHVRPDGDTVGCAAALCAALRALGMNGPPFFDKRRGGGAGAAALKVIGNGMVRGDAF